MQKIYFKDSQGFKICGILSKFIGKSKGIIILCHGLATSKNSETNKRLEKELNKLKISTLRFDFFGHGESDGNFRNMTVSKGIDNILNAINFLKKRGETKIGLVGSSFGGISSILATARSKDIDVLALKSPVSNCVEVETLRNKQKDLENWAKKGYLILSDLKCGEKKLNYNFFKDAQNNIVYSQVEKIQIPTLIVHGDMDNIVPIEQSIKTSKGIKNCKLKIIRGANHSYSEKHEFEEMINEIVLFINKYYS